MTVSRNFVSICVAFLISGCAANPPASPTGGKSGDAGCGGSNEGGSGGSDGSGGSKGGGGSGPGGSGGSPPMGGAGGAPPMGTVTIGQDDMIDDMEDGDDAILPIGKRVGFWY